MKKALLSESNNLLMVCVKLSLSIVNSTYVIPWMFMKHEPKCNPFDAVLLKNV